MNRTISVLAVVASGALAACATSTSFKSSWRNPVAQSFSFSPEDKVLAVVVTDEQSLRHGAEASLARALTARGVQGIPSYTIIPQEMLADKEQSKAAAQRAGAVGAVVMTVIGQDKALSASTPVYGAGYYGSFWGSYWGWGWGYARPGYIRTDTLVYVETLVFDLRQQEALVWAGRSESTNPKNVDSFVQELVGKAARELRKQGLVKK